MYDGPGSECHHQSWKRKSKSMIFVDTHTHLYVKEFNQDSDKVIQTALDNGVKFFFLPNIDSEYIMTMLCLCISHPHHCFPMMGLHPTSVKENYENELEIVTDMLADPKLKFWGIGEIGIDLYRDKTFEREQLSVFSYQLDLAIRYGLPAIIHTRNSFDIAIRIIEEKNNPSLKGIFHCFGGSVGQAEKAINMGFKLGIGGIITYKNSGLQKVVEMFGLEHFLLETDSPWLPPVPHRGERNESGYIPLIAAKIAEIKKITIEEVADVTTNTALRLFKVNP
jgi:TatD DNase family protein